LAGSQAVLSSLSVINVHLRFSSADSSALCLNPCRSDLPFVETFCSFVNLCLDHTVIPILNDFSSVTYIFTQKLDLSSFCLCAVVLSTVCYNDCSGETEAGIDANVRRVILFRFISIVFTGRSSMNVSSFSHGWFPFSFSAHNNVFNSAAQKQNNDV
jgi:hypothetical protein